MLVNFNKILHKAKLEHYAVPHFNINNLEWTKYILEECNKLNVPVILGVSEGAIKYMGGYNVVSQLVQAIIKDLNIKIPVCLHLDHGSSIDSCKKAIDAGFTSVMIDASDKNLNTNIDITKQVVDYAHQKNVSVEGEVGYIGKEGDQLIKNATLEDCQKIYSETKLDALAPALGSHHGLYKEKPNLDFETMKILNEKLPIPIVLHGGTGISDDQIKKSISNGISKININTDLQTNWSKSVKKYIIDNNEIYDPRKIIGSGEESMKKRIDEIVTLFETRL